MSRLRISVSGRTIVAELNDSATARDLVALLPTSLSFRDYGGQEKTARLPRALTTSGAPEGADPGRNEISYYVPDQVLVLHYADIGYFPGIVRLGRMPADDMAFIRSQPDGFEASISVVEE